MNHDRTKQIPQHKPEMNREFLQRAATDIKAKLPDNWGFLLLAAPFGDPAKESGHRLVYTSDMERSSAIALVKEWLIKAGAEEEWMKHLK